MSDRFIKFNDETVRCQASNDVARLSSTLIKKMNKHKLKSKNSLTIILFKMF